LAAERRGEVLHQVADFDGGHGFSHGWKSMAE
jgi:hypothetical protein